MNSYTYVKSLLILLCASASLQASDPGYYWRAVGTVAKVAVPLASHGVAFSAGVMVMGKFAYQEGATNGWQIVSDPVYAAAEHGGERKQLADPSGIASCAARGGSDLRRSSACQAAPRKLVWKAKVKPGKIPVSKEHVAQGLRYSCANDAIYQDEVLLTLCAAGMLDPKTAPILMQSMALSPYIRGFDELKTQDDNLYTQLQAAAGSQEHHVMLGQVYEAIGNVLYPSGGQCSAAGRGQQRTAAHARRGGRPRSEGRRQSPSSSASSSSSSSSSSFSSGVAADAVSSILGQENGGPFVAPSSPSAMGPGFGDASGNSEQEGDEESRG